KNFQCTSHDCCPSIWPRCLVALPRRWPPIRVGASEMPRQKTTCPERVAVFCPGWKAGWRAKNCRCDEIERSALSNLNVLRHESCVLDELIPGAADAPLVGADMTDGEAQRQPAAEARVREKDFTGAVHEIDQSLVGGIELRLRQRHAGRLPAEADHAERNRRHALEIG